MPKFLLFLQLFLFQTFGSWEKLEPGLELGTFHSLQYPDSVSANITILRIDPDHFDLRLLNSTSPNQGNSFSALQWCKKEHLTAAINASMYQTDYKTSVSFMKTGKHCNNCRLSKDKTILVFNPKSSNVPMVKIIDRQCDDFTVWKPGYVSFVQNIRMVGCDGKNVWQQSPQPWSIAAIGTDKKGQVLFIFSVKPHTVHDFIDVLMQLPIDLDRAMYVEGAHVAQLAVTTRKKELELIGEYTGMGYSPAEAPAIPNIIGIIRKH